MVKVSVIIPAYIEECFKRIAKVIEEVFPPSSDRFEIDSKILLKTSAKDFHTSSILVTYTPKGSSKVDKFRTPLSMLISLLRWRLSSKLSGSSSRGLGAEKD